MYTSETRFLENLKQEKTCEKSKSKFKVMKRVSKSKSKYVILFIP